MNCTLKDLYDFIRNEGESIKGIKVNTRYGYRDILGVDITAKNSDVHKVVLSSGKFLKTSPDHLLWTTEWVKVKNLKPGDYLETEHGLEEITSNEILDYKDDLYDIEVDVVHEFFANNIVSHNSTMSDVIKFGLYGRVDSKKLRDLPNRFNGNLWVKIVIEKNPTTTVIIERGIAPSVFRVSVNGIDYDQAGKKNVQDYVEEEVLGIPFYVFNNMISLSINDFKSFISMGAHDKRMIIDRLFGLEILGHIRWKVKYKLKTLKDCIENIDTEISVLERSIKTSYTELDSLNEKLKTASAEKKNDLQEKIEKYSDFIASANKKLQAITIRNTEVRELMHSWSKEMGDHKAEEKVCTQKITLYKAGKCPTCESDLTTDHHKSVFHEFVERSSVAKEAVEDITKKINELHEKQKNLDTMYKELNEKKTITEAHVNNWKSELKKLNEGQVIDNQTESLKNLIKDAQENKDTAIIKKGEEGKKINFLKIVEDIFGDKGVKLSALKRIIPLLNLEIRNVMTDLNMDYRVTFNEEFDVNIQHLGFAVSPEQLSTGERKKVDFATLIALIRLMKIRFTGINLTFLDEIFSSIDSDSIYHVVKVLHKTCKELNLNIFVINHSQLPIELFDYLIQIEKKNGFSNLIIEKTS
jgi:DNA repair exonuclease SbcCD ATPase subunit